MVPKKVYMFYFLAYLGLPRLIRKDVSDLITPGVYQNLFGISKDYMEIQQEVCCISYLAMISSKIATSPFVNS